jgi:hypothetical protein
LAAGLVIIFVFVFFSAKSAWKFPAMHTSTAGGGPAPRFLHTMVPWTRSRRIASLGGELHTDSNLPEADALVRRLFSGSAVLFSFFIYFLPLFAFHFPACS